MTKITYATRPTKRVGKKTVTLPDKLMAAHKKQVAAWLAQAQSVKAFAAAGARMSFSPASTLAAAAVLPIVLPPGYSIIGDPVVRRVFDWGDGWGKALYEQYNLVPGATHIQEEQRNDGSWQATGTEIVGPADGGFWTMGAAVIENDLLRDYYRMRIELP